MASSGSFTAYRYQKTKYLKYLQQQSGMSIDELLSDARIEIPLPFLMHMLELAFWEGKHSQAKHEVSGLNQFIKNRLNVDWKLEKEAD
jgi:hypothetical protein